MVKTREQQHWLSLVFRLKGSVIPGILNQVILYGAFGVLISIAYLVFKLPVNQPGFSIVIPSVVLGLLLVFRTNTAYERFWEGRKLWATIVTQSLNVGRQIWSGAQEIEPDDREKKIAVLRLLVAFAVAI
jgi:putative membrane protein